MKDFLPIIGFANLVLVEILVFGPQTAALMHQSDYILLHLDGNILVLFKIMNDSISNVISLKLCEPTAALRLHP